MHPLGGSAVPRSMPEALHALAETPARRWPRLGLGWPFFLRVQLHARDGRRCLRAVLPALQHALLKTCDISPVARGPLRFGIAWVELGMYGGRLCKVNSQRVHDMLAICI